MTAYVIWAPPYTHRSGGVRALYQLCAMLRTEGQDAAIQLMDGGAAYDGDWPEFESPYDAPPVTQTDDDAIVIYPETIVDNPAGAGRFVRWLLGPADRDGVCFQWLPSMGDRPVLHVPIVEPDLFYPGHGNRAGTALWVGKASAEHRERYYPTDVEVIEIQRDDPPTRADLADLLRSVDRLVSLDAFSSLNLEAAMCGTPVRAYSDGTATRWRGTNATVWSRVMLESSYVSTAGIAYDDEPWEAATSTVWDAYDLYVAAGPLKVRSVRRFIHATQLLATGVC